MRQARNCDGEGPRLHFPHDPDLRMCPRAHYPAEAWDALNAWWRWKTLSDLPFPGSLDDQPEYVAEILETLEVHHTEALNDRAKKAAAERGAK